MFEGENPAMLEKAAWMSADNRSITDRPQPSLC